MTLVHGTYMLSGPRDGAVLVMNMIRRKLSSRNAFLIGIVSLVLGVLMQAAVVLFEVVAIDTGWIPIMHIALLGCAIFLPLGYVTRSDDSGTRIGWFLLLIGLLMMPSALILHSSLGSVSIAWSVLTASLALDAIFIVLAGFLVFAYKRGQRMQWKDKAYPPPPNLDSHLIQSGQREGLPAPVGVKLEAKGGKTGHYH